MAVETSILKTVRQSIGPSASYDVFDGDLITNINVAISRLAQLGALASPPYKVTSVDDTWSNLSLVEDGQLDDIKQYICLKTKMVFDPPASSAVSKAYEEQLATLEWTLKEVARFGY